MALKLIKAGYPGDNLEKLARTYGSIVEQHKMLSQLLDELKQEILDIIGTSQFSIVFDLGTSLEVKEIAGVDTVDLKKLAEEYPEAAAACVKKGQPSIKIEVLVPQTLPSFKNMPQPN
jgi:hypothetical protein